MSLFPFYTVAFFPIRENLSWKTCQCRTGVIVVFQSTLHQWLLVLYIASGMYLLGALVYLFMATGEQQQWNDKSVIRTGLLWNGGEPEVGEAGNQKPQDEVRFSTTVE